jgi:hypothetical protein
MATKKKSGKEKPPPVDKLILPAIGVGLALLAYQFFSGIKNEVCMTFICVSIRNSILTRMFLVGVSSEPGR